MAGATRIFNGVIHEMKLSGLEIMSRVEQGSIVIKPFFPSQMNPNSYDLRLADTLLVYDEQIPLDMAKQPIVSKVIIPANGFVLRPGELYLGSTLEYTESNDLIPGIEGRSSVGRLGINVHSTAGFGDVGFCGTWTLELSVVRPVRVYAGVRICQIYYEPVVGEFIPYKSNKYQGQTLPRPSALWKESEEWR